MIKIPYDKPVTVEGIKFYFGGEKEIKTKKGKEWLSFNAYIEFAPGMAILMRNLRIINNRPAPPMAPYAQGLFYNIVFFSRGMAELLVEALKQWPTVMDNPKWNPLGALDPAKGLSYTKAKAEELLTKREEEEE